MSTTSNTRVEAQLELEALSVDLGIQRYREALAAGRESELPPGQQLIRAAMQPCVAAVQKWLEETGSGLAARNAGVFYFINQFDPEALAWVTASTILQSLHRQPSLTSLALTVAERLEGHINLEALTKEAPALAKKVQKAMDTMNHERNKLVLVRKAMGKADVKCIQWEVSTRVRVGTVLVALFAESTGLVAVETIPGPRGTTHTTVRPTESCRRWLEEAHARCELLSPVRLPMVCRPRSWTNPFNGGYLTKQLRQPLVKTRNKGYLQALKEHDMPWVYATVNALQDTEWSVNTAIYELVKSLWEANRDAPGLPSREPLPIPAKPWAEGETPAPEVLSAWKVEAAKTYETNAKTEAKRMQLVQKLWVAEEMMQRGNCFHYVYNLDWRGRIYPVGPVLTPQGDDVAKAMLRFTRGVPLGSEGAYWLAIHGANTYGVDKVSFEERIQWVEDNLDLILAVAEDPMGTQHIWAAVDHEGKCKVESPFCFVAFCLEWAKLQAHVDAGLPESAFVSHLAVAFDGACNGLQNFSAMLRDPVGGAATGLVPSDRPSDIYTKVAQATQELINQDAAQGHEVAVRWVGKMTRKLAKRNTMTVPYGVTRRGMRDQLFGEIKDLSSSSTRAADAAYLAEKNYEAIGTVVVAARRAMDWLKEAAKVAASTDLPVKWVTPAGFLAVQDYREDEGEELDFVVMGRRYRLTVVKTGSKLSGRKQALGISPNFVHSLDAAHLKRTVLFCVQDGMKDFAMIHDSYGVHAGHAARLRDNLREAFVEQYSAPVLQQFRDQLLEQLPPEKHAELPELPPMGDLDLEQVKQSEYFFA
ncbi:MAG: DNA-directed RNA polymerase [Aquabacterium sp.]